MEKNGQHTTASNASRIEEIAALLISSWPIIRKRFVHINAIQTECSMPISHMQLLAMLAREESLSITQISERFGIAKPNITPMVDRMIAEGLVMRTRSSQDKRIVSVVICDKGRERLDEIHVCFCRTLESWAEKHTPAEIEEFYGALQTIVRLLYQED